MRGRARVTEQCLLTAVCQNIKKMAMLLWRRSMGLEGGPFSVISVQISLFSSDPYTKPICFPLGLSHSFSEWPQSSFLIAARRSAFLIQYLHITFCAVNTDILAVFQYFGCILHTNNSRDSVLPCHNRTVGHHPSDLCHERFR